MARYGSQFGPGLDTTSQVEVYRNAEYRQRCLRHKIVKGWHVVSVEYPLLERSQREAYAVRSTGEARDYWVGLREWMEREGYRRVTR